MRDRVTALMIGMGGSSVATIGIMMGTTATGYVGFLSLAYIVIGFSCILYCIWNIMGDGKEGEDQDDR